MTPDQGSCLVMPGYGVRRVTGTADRARGRHGGNGHGTAGTMTDPITVSVVDDQPVVIEGISSWIGRDPGGRLRLVHSAGALDDVPETDVLIVDLELAGGLAAERIAELAAAGRRIVVFSQHARRDLVLKVIDAGASAYVTKTEGPENLVETVIAVARDRPHVTRSHGGARPGDTRPLRPALSRRESTALRWWFQGMSKASVARRMGISEHTAKQYIDRARLKYARLGRPAPTKDTLLARAIEDGLIDPGEVGSHESGAHRRPGQGA